MAQGKARLLNIVQSNCVWNGLAARPEYKKPFDVLAKGLLSGYWLPGQDSNLRPAGYKDSQSFERAWTISSPACACRRGCRALVRPYWVGSSASSLCTFLPTHLPFGRLRSGFPYRLSAG